MSWQVFVLFAVIIVLIFLLRSARQSPETVHRIPVARFLHLNRHHAGHDDPSHSEVVVLCSVRRLHQFALTATAWSTLLTELDVEMENVVVRSGVPGQPIGDCTAEWVDGIALNQRAVFFTSDDAAQMVINHVGSVAGVAGDDTVIVGYVRGSLPFVDHTCNDGCHTPRPVLY